MLPDLPSDILAALAHNHYDRLWIDFSILTPQRALEQAKIPWYRSDDPHTEHNRWDTWGAYLAANESLSDEQLANLLLLAEIDPDPSMAVSMLLALLLHLPLADAQFERVAAAPLLTAHSRGVAQLRLRRRLGRGEWSTELVAICLEQGDSSAQRMLLDHPELDRPTVALLATQGRSRGIRNMAGRLLRSHRFRIA